MESLALKYRPHTLDDLVGQPAVQVFLRQMVATNRVPAALLFDGPRGTGKTTTARILAAALNCEDHDGTNPPPCGHCPSCKAVFNGTSVDLVEIDAASNGLVDDIRSLRQQVMYTVGGRYRVVMLDEAHSMSTAAFNALLKTLEEPPPATVMILLTTEPGRILDTVLSRSMPFTFHRIGVADIVARLTHISQQEGLDPDPALLAMIAERADGGLRDAIMTLDQLRRAGVDTVEAYTELIGETDFGPVLLRHLAHNDRAAAFTALREQMAHTGDASAIADTLARALTDVLVLHCGAQISKQGNALDTRKELAEAIAPSRAVAALRVLWELKTRVRVGEDARTTLDLAVVMVAEALASTAPTTAAPPAARKLTLAEMAAMR